MPAMRPIQRIEWIFPIALALGIALAGSLPYAYGYLTAGEGEVFAGFIGRGTPGAQSYLAFARQVAEGGALTTNLYNPHAPSRAFFHAEWWLMGMAARLTGLPLLFWFHAGRVVSAIAFLLAVYYLASTLLDNVRLRRGALLLVAVGAGFGWLVVAANAVSGTHLDLPLDAKGVTIFGYLMNKPHFIRAGCVAALQYAWLIRGDATGKYRYFLYSGLAASAHSLVRPYQIPEACLILVLYAGARVFIDHQPILATLTRVASAASGHAPAIIWQGWVYFKNPLGLGAMDAWAPMPLLPLILWLGLPFTAVMVHLGTWVLREDRSRLALSIPALWLAAAALLMQAHPYFPWGTESYYPWVFAPVLLFLRHTWPVLAAWATHRPQPRRLALAALCCTVLPVNALVYVQFFTTLHHPKPPWQYYLPQSALDAIAWLDENAPAESVVLASHDSSAFIPRFADLRVVTGQDALTPDYRVVNEHVQRFFQNTGDQGFKQWLLREQQVDYVLVGPFERALAGEATPRYPWLQQVYQSGDVQVFATARIRGRE